MTEGISQEARFLFKELERFAVAGRDYSRILDGEAIEVIDAAMQSLINSTIERCAAVAENGWVPAYVMIPEGGLKGDWQPGSPWDRGAVDACQRVATAIRQMKGRTNV